MSIHKGTKDSDLKRKKHKKHKKHKKSGKVDKLEKDLHSKKKHKKQHKRKHRESDDSDSDVAEKLPTKNAPTSLSSKFTEIMKTNGHSTTTGLAAKLIKSIKKPAVPTDPTALVEMITQSLDPNAPPSLEIVSSESESDGVIQDVDVDSPDVAVIEDELNLEELMKQKALLQARLGNIASESEEEQPVEVKQPAPKKVSDVILLDDSSGEVMMHTSSVKKRQRSASLSRDRKRRDERRESQERRDRYNREQDKMKQRRSDDNRNKEDLRREIDRDKERSFRDRRRDGGGRMDARFNRDRNRYSIDGDRRGNQRSRSRDRYDRDNTDRGRDRDRGNKKREEKNDKFVGSLSEGQKADKESSSDSEIGDIKVNENEDEDDEEKIIELRRKKREELMKKLALSQPISQSQPVAKRRDSDEDVVVVQNEKPVEKKTLTPPPTTRTSKQVTSTEPVVIDSLDDVESTTPPLPAGMLPLKLVAKAKPQPSSKAEESVTKTEKKNDDDLINHEKVNKIKEATKRSEWDMFAEQDNYSNFDVSKFSIFLMH